MSEPDTYATSRAWSWRHAIAKSGLPPITRLVLHTLGLKMDATGGSCYPPISELVDLTGLDKKTVMKHLEIAEENGWIEVAQHGFRGQKWKRNEYVARWPGRDLTGEPVRNDDEKGGGAVPPPSEKVVEMVPEGGGTGSQKVVEELHQDKILPANIPSNLPAAGAEGGGLTRADRNRIETEYATWFGTWKNGVFAYGRNTWFSLSNEERAACIKLTPVYLASIKAKEGDHAAAVYLKNRAWEKVAALAEASHEPSRGIAKVGGKLWMGTRLKALSQEPTAVLVVTAFDEREIERGTTTRAELLRKKRMEYGWPLVTSMRDLARRGEPFVTSLDILPHVADFRQVERGTELFSAWEALHERRGWPFVEQRNQYLWFPPIADGATDMHAAVEAALKTFLSSVSEAGQDDAA